MTQLMHSLPWTLAIALAAQAGEPDRDLAARLEHLVVQASAGPASREEIQLNSDRPLSDDSGEEPGSRPT